DLRGKRSPVTFFTHGLASAQPRARDQGSRGRSKRSAMPRRKAGSRSKRSVSMSSGLLKSLEDIQSQFNRAAPRRQESLARRSARSGGWGGGGGGREEGRPRREGSVPAGTDGHLAGADRCCLVRRARTDRGWLPQLRQGHVADARRGVARRQG